MRADRERDEQPDARAQAARAATPTPAPAPVARVLALQAGVGNAVVARLMAARQAAAAPAAPAPAEAEDPSKVEPTPGAPGPPLPAPRPRPAAGPLPKPPKPAKKPGARKRGPLGGPVRRGGRGRRAVGPVPVPGGARPSKPVEPDQDPAFKGFKARVGGAKARAGAHPPAASEAAAAQAAALPPGNEVASQAAAAQVEEMGAQKPGGFDRAAFIAGVQKAVEAASPSSLEEADEFKESGKAEQVAGQVGGMVKAGKEAAEGPIKDATTAPPDPGKATPKPVVPLAPEPPAAALGKVGAGAAMPPPRPAEDTDLSAGPKAVDKEMADAGVSEKTLASSGEPEFAGALASKKQAETHAATAPGAYRKEEAGTLKAGQAEAEAVAGKELAGMQASQVKAITQVAGAKAATKSEDEAKRAKIAADLDAIYAKTKSEVTAILDGLEPKVTAAFDEGEKAARAAFEAEVEQKMAAFKDDRYSGLRGPFRWLRDKAFGMPDAVNAFYEQGKANYTTAMSAVIEKVATIVETDLNAATARIAAGRDEIRAYVEALPKDLQKLGAQAASDVQGKFDELKGEVEAKGQALVDTVASKYKAARDQLDERIEALKAANKGWVDKALDAVVGVIKTILKLKDMLLGVLAKAAGVIGDIISDPIGFLGNLISGIGAGLSKFIGNIWTHLQNALMSWLFGALGSAGIKLPAKLDLMGILDLVLQILGLTYANIRARAVKIVGADAIEHMESAVDVFKTLVKEGPAGLWKWVVEKLSNLEDLVLGQIKTFLVEKVIKAGITWIIGLLNPAAAFIKACKLIYDVVMFFVERGSQIMEFVNSILDSVAAIVKGNVGAVADAIDRSLGNILPLAISFLASLLGLGGISDKIKSIIDTVRSPIDKAIDAIVGGAANLFKKTFGKAIAWGKGKVQQGKDWVKGKVEAGKEWAKDKAGAVKDKLTGKDERTPDQKQAALTAAVGEARALDTTVGRKKVLAGLKQIKDRHKLTDLTGTPAEDGTLKVHAAVNPELTFEVADYDDGMLEDMHAGFVAASAEVAGLTAAQRTEPEVTKRFQAQIRQRHAGVVVSLRRQGDKAQVMGEPSKRKAIALGTIDLVTGAGELDPAVALRGAIVAARAAIEGLGATATLDSAEAACTAAVRAQIPGANLQYKRSGEGLGREAYYVVSAAERTFMGVIVGGETDMYQVIGQRGPQQLLAHRLTRKEFVRGAKDLVVPRYVWRNVNSTERAILTDKGDEIMPDLPPRPMAPDAPKGLRGKVAKDPWTHATNAKMASIYSSATVIEGGQIVNRVSGQRFNVDGTIKIDLLQVDPEVIVVLSTAEGRRAWGFVDSAPDRAEQDAAATREVLIQGGIPGRAIVPE